MCTGGQDIPATIRVDGGVEDGQWKTSDTFNPSSSEETSIVESSEEATETMEPSAGLYQPVIDRINTLSERLPEKISKETTNEISPILNNLMGTTHRGFDRTQMGLRSLQNRLNMGGIRPRIYPPRPPSREKYTGLGGKVAIDTFNKGGFGGKGFGSGRNRAIERVRQEQRPISNYPISTPQNSPMQQVMQPPVIEEQVNQMEILGQPKQFKNGGIIEALMMTPIGQNEIKKLAVGGVVGGLDTLVGGGQQTGASLEDISLGKATFFEPYTYNTKAKDTLESIEETLGIIPKKKKIIENQEQFGDHEDRDGPYSGKEIGGVGESPESYTGGMKGTSVGGIASLLGNLGSTIATFTPSGMAGKLFSLGNMIFNPEATAKKVGSYIADQFSSPETRNYGGGPQSQADINQGMNVGPEQNPVHVGMHESEFGGDTDGFVGADGESSVDVGGYDSGIDASGQATGQELGEEDDSYAWG